MTNTQASLTLWGVSVSPYVRKVRIALALKGLDYKQQAILPTLLATAAGQEVPETFTAISPLGRIPALQHGDVALADSSVILQYLDGRFPETPALYPNDPAVRARVQWLERYGDEPLTMVTYQQIFVPRVVGPMIYKTEPDEAAVSKALTESLPPLLDYLESSLGDQSWFGGTELSAADLGIGTQFVAMGLAKAEVDKARWPKLAGFVERFKAHSTVASVLASE